MPSLFPPVPQPAGTIRPEPAPDTYTGPMVQEPEVWWAVCARCGERYPVPPGESSAPHICLDLKGEAMAVVYRTERDESRHILDRLLQDLDCFSDKIKLLEPEIQEAIKVAKHSRTWA